MTRRRREYVGEMLPEQTDEDLRNWWQVPWDDRREI